MPTLAQDKLGAVLIARGLLDAQQLRAAQRAAQMEKRSLQQILVLRKMVDESVLTNIVSELIGIPFVDLSTFIFDPKITKGLNPDVARKLQAIPLFKIGTTLSVALTDPTDILKVDQLRSKTGCKIETYLCSESEMQRALEQFYPSTGIETLVKEMGQEAPDFDTCLL